MNDSLQQFIALARRYPIVVVSLVVFIGLGVANYFLWDRQHELALHHDEVRHKGETILQAQTTHPRVVTELSVVEDALEQIDSNLVVESDLAENAGFFYQIETLSRIRLSGLSQLSSQPAPEGNPYRAVPFAFHVTGSYNQIIGLLHELETGPRILRVKSCSLNRPDPKTNALNMDITVELLGSR